MILQGDALEVLKTLPSESVNMCVTSPPYYGLRDYGVDGQIGLEETPEDYIQRLVAVFQEVKRVLKDDGTLWVNIADSYCGTGDKGKYKDPKYAEGRNGQSVSLTKTVIGCKPKDLIGIPWMLAFAIRADGWYLREDIIWKKDNPMPESVRDRCTKSHEYIFLLSKSPRYYFDQEAISEPTADSTIKRMSQDIEHQAGSCRQQGKTNGPMKAVPPRYGGKKYTDTPDVFNRTKSGGIYQLRSRRNKRDVWTVNTTPFKGAHFAVFPEQLIAPCILAGSPPDGGVVLDCFSGAGTTGVVCAKLGRQYIGIELNPKYVQLSEERIGKVQEEIDAEKAQCCLF